MKMQSLKKYLALGLAAICMAVTFSADTEAAGIFSHREQQRQTEQHRDNRDKNKHQNARRDTSKNKAHKSSIKYSEKGTSDTIFFRYLAPSGHQVCNNPRHRKWGAHFHCSNRRHDHKDTPNMRRYDKCHDLDSFGNDNP